MQFFFFFFFCKIISGMANSIQEQSDLGFHCLHTPFRQARCTKFYDIYRTDSFLIFLLNHTLRIYVRAQLFKASLA